MLMQLMVSGRISSLSSSSSSSSSFLFFSFLFLFQRFWSRQLQPLAISSHSSDLKLETRLDSTRRASIFLISRRIRSCIRVRSTAQPKSASIRCRSNAHAHACSTRGLKRREGEKGTWIRRLPQQQQQQPEQRWSKDYCLLFPLRRRLRGRRR